MARRRGLVFDITTAVAFDLFAGDCFYCGAAPNQVQRPTSGTVFTQPFIYNGIDRLDSAVGYQAGNVVSCCGICNKAKLDRSYLDFVNWIARVHRNLHSRGIPLTG